jgi:hypothetical protein
MVPLAATDLDIALALGIVVAVLVAIATLVVGFAIDAMGDGDDVIDDVQRYIELSAKAHADLSDRPLLSDPDGATSAAIDQLLARKEQARQALWQSRYSRTGSDLRTNRRAG